MNFLLQFKQETAHALPPAALTCGVMGTGMVGGRGWDRSRCGTHPARLQHQHGAGKACSEQVCLHPRLPPPALFHFALELPALAPQPDLQQQQGSRMWMSGRSGSTGASSLPAASPCTLQHYRPPVLPCRPRPRGNNPAPTSPQDSLCWSNQDPQGAWWMDGHNRHIAAPIQHEECL